MRTPKKTFDAAAKRTRRSFTYRISDEERRRALNPPVDNGVVEVIHGYKVSDPFRPLENLTAPETTAWIERQNKRFADYIAPAQAFVDETADFLRKSLPRGTIDTVPYRRKKNLYTFWRREEGQDLWSLFKMDKPDGIATASLLLDPLKIDPTGKTSIASISFSSKADILAYTLSVSGRDKQTIHFMNMKTGEHLPLAYPAASAWMDGIDWEKKKKIFTYRHAVDGLAGSYGIMRHVMGQDPSEDAPVYIPTTPETRTSLLRIKRYEFISETQTGKENANRLLIRKRGSDAPFVEIHTYSNGLLLPESALDGKIYALALCGKPRVVRFDPKRPAPEHWETIIDSHPEDTLIGFTLWKKKVLASYMHNTADKTRIFDKNGKALGEMPLPPMSVVSQVGAFRPKKNTNLFSVSSFQEDESIYTYNLRTNKMRLYRPSRSPINLKDCIVEQLHATSKDGTRIPMTIIRHPDTQLDGSAATLLYGYGGFEISLNPGFSGKIACWVRAGGIYAQANLRGGGEFGKDWYNQGRKHNKQNVFDDFAACAEHLIGEKYTSPQRLAIEGGSNGGLLTLATGLQRPDLFGAIVSSVPVADMNRFHIGSTYGYSWKSDYGDPDVKADFNAAAKYSPYHNVRKGVALPPVFIRTDADDDRVSPWHGYKMAALLQARTSKKTTVVMHVSSGGGHKGNENLSYWVQNTANTFAFLARSLGPINQNAYKKSLKDTGTNRKRKPRTP